MGLEMAADNLKSLEIRNSDFPSSNGYHQSIECGLLQSLIEFPSLTHLNIGLRAFQLGEALPLIINASPNLTHLDVSVELKEKIFNDNSRVPQFPLYHNDTKIRFLTLAIDHRTCDNGDWPESPALALLKRTPMLQQLHYWWDNANEHIADIIKCMSELRSLRDLIWEAGEERTFKQARGIFSEGGFDSLRKAVIDNQPNEPDPVSQGPEQAEVSSLYQSRTFTFISPILPPSRRFITVRERQNYHWRRNPSFVSHNHSQFKGCYRTFPNVFVYVKHFERSECLI